MKTLFDVVLFDVVVLGAGPAGSNAAIAAAAQGVSVALLDEAPKAGGQIWRAKSPAVLSAPPTPESRRGDALRDRLQASGVKHLAGVRVWSFGRTDEGWHIHYADDTEVGVLHSKALILAQGAQERVFAVPGWTLPGVIGLAGTTALLKENLTPPRGRTVVAGNGPLLFFVASEVERLGGRVVAVVCQNSLMDWLKATPALLTRPVLALRGAKWLLGLRRKSIPVHWRSAALEVVGVHSVEKVVVGRLDREWTPVANKRITIEADNLCLGHGLQPGIDAARMAGVAIKYVPSLGGWVPEAEPDRSTAVPGLFICGDGAGILGADAAVVQGQLAGQSAVGYIDPEQMDAGKQHALLKRSRKCGRFGAAMTQLSIPRRGQLVMITPDTIVCRCESLCRAEIESENATGAVSTNALKSGTRAGMGFCGGRFCMDTVARLMSEQSGKIWRRYYRRLHGRRCARFRWLLSPVSLNTAACRYPGRHRYD